MDDEQYTRWKDFSLRMARTCFKGSRRPASAWILEKVQEWFYWRDYQKDWGNYNSWDQDSYPLCDHISEFFDDCGPYYLPCDDDDDYRNEDIRRELAYEQYEDQWLGPVRCCIRAGIDFACEPSAGVIGFTAGDVRRMYPEGVPEWVFPAGERLHYWPNGEMNGAFVDLPDNAHVVL